MWMGATPTTKTPSMAQGVLTPNLALSSVMQLRLWQKTSYAAQLVAALGTALAATSYRARVPSRESLSVLIAGR
jgi:hypothetical protein